MESLGKLKGISHLIEKFGEQGIMGVVALLFLALFVWQLSIVHIRAENLEKRVLAFEEFYRGVLLEELEKTREVILLNTEIIQENTIYLRMLRQSDIQCFHMQYRSFTVSEVE